MTVRGQPHAGDHEVSIARRMAQGKQPRTLGGLLAWYDRAIRAETPEKLHIMEPWHDRVSQHELGEGVQPVGGSHLGTLAYSGSFRTLLESSPSAADEDGYYFTPVRSALSRIFRRRPLMASFLFRLTQAGGDWKRIADDLRYPHEILEVYTEACLRQLWREYAERTSTEVA